MLPESLHEQVELETAIAYADGFRDGIAAASVAFDHHIAEAIDPGPLCSTVLRFDVQMRSAKAVVKDLVARMNRAGRPAQARDHPDYSGGRVDFETGITA